ncbi:MAG TPA: FlgD immunoglobulin-like domain containing protein, partial [Spirochaetia bacterium]|nr:FlgD immunoglobulin-like domain containing protein [Spirochaetia bacterium]
SLTLADNLTLAGTIAVGVTAGSAFDVTNRTVTVAGNVTYSASLATFTATGSTFVFNGTTTLTSSGKQFNNVQVGTAALAGAVTLGDNLTLINASGNLSMIQGTLTLNTHTLVLGVDLTMSPTAASQIAIGTGTLDGTTNGRDVTLSNAFATITQSTGTLKALSLSVSAGAYTLSGAGTVTLGTGGLSQSGGTITANAAQMRSSGNVSILAAGTFVQGGSTLTMDTTATSVQVVTPNQLFNLTIGVAATGTVTIAANDLTLQNNLSVTSGWTFDTNGLSLNVGGSATVSGTLDGPNAVGKSISVTGDTTCSGTINLRTSDYSTNNLTVSGVAPAGLVASGSENITVNGSIDFSAAGNNYTPATSTVIMAGTATPVSLNCPPTEDPFYELTINKGALARTVTLTSDILVTHSVTITSGTLSAGTHQIEMQGIIWDNAGSKTGVGFFNPGTGTVLFTTTSTILIKGNNSWFDFNCTTNGKTFQFEHLWTQTIIANGHFNVLGSSLLSRIVLTTDLADPTAHLPVPPAENGQWIIANLSVLPQNIDYIDVSYSYAWPNAITPGPNTKDSGHNFNWNFVIPIIASWTLDTNNNGRIDRIRVQVQAGTQLNNNFSNAGFKVVVNGYSIAGFQGVGGNTDVFDILLKENPPNGPAEDSNVTPTWQLLANPQIGLFGLIGGAYVEASTTKAYTASDGARPVINYTLAALGSKQAYVHFSEPVTNNVGAPIGLGNLVYSDAGNPVTSLVPVEVSSTGAHAAIVTFTNPLSANDIFLGPVRNIQAATAVIFGAAAAVDPAPYPNAIADGNLPPNASRGMLNPSTTPAAPAHNVSDVGLGFVVPVLAQDQDVVRDPTRGGMGLATVFDGSKWLPPHNTLIEARIMVPSMAGNTLSLAWDVNPPSTFDLNGFWLPTGSSTLWPVVWPAAAGGDRAHSSGIPASPGDPQARIVPSSGTNGPLRDFIISKADPAIKDGSLFQFIFLLDDGSGNKLPVMFAPNAANPADVRPFEYQIHSVVQQRGGVSVTNNVINPGAGQTAFVHYTLDTSGQVTIMVFDLSGSIVNILQRGTQGAGEYTTAWDGKNRGGRIVARGIYFIRVVGPGFDEIRKVLVVH